MKLRARSEEFVGKVMVLLPTNQKDSLTANLRKLRERQMAAVQVQE
jgi:hypothetical protein